MTLVVLLFGTLFADDVFVVQASFPVARFRNGTVGLKNDGGVVQVQSTDFVVDGNMHVSGVLTVQGQDISKYEERVSYLETTLGANVTSSEASTCVGSTVLSSKPSSLTHWIDFSTTYMQSLYGMGDGSNIDTFEDLMGNAANIKVNGNVKYTPNAQNGLGAVYMNAEYTGTEFTSSKAGRNPEVFMAFRNVEYIAAGVSFGSRYNGYGFGTYKAGDGAIGVTATTGSVMVQQDIDYSKWHVADIYFGETDGFAIFDDEDLGNSFGISGKYSTQSLTNVIFGFYPATGHYAHQYVGEVLIFNEKLSESDRSMVTSYLMSKWGISSSSASTSCAESWIDKPSSVVSQLQSLMPPRCMSPGGKALFSDGTSWICECVQNSTHVYYGTSCENTCIQNATQIWDTATSSCQERVTQVTDLNCAIIDGLGTFETIGGKSMYVCNGYALLLAYNHAANAEVVAVGYSTGVAPTSPVSSNAHIVADMIDKSVDDIESVKFFCNTTNHERIMNFRTENDKIRSAMVDGVYNPGCTYSCTSAGPDLSTGYTLLEGHTTRLPATTTRLHNTATSKNDFGIYGTMWNGGTCGHCPPSYGWHIGAHRGNFVDPITDYQCDSESIGATDATSHQIWVKFKQ